MQTIEAIIFDIGGVLWRTNGMRLSDKWAERVGLSSDSFDQIVFASEWGAQALSGEITSVQLWQNIGSALNLPTDSVLELKQDYWAGRWDVELFEYIRTLKSKFKLGIISDASDDAREMVQEWINETLFDEIVISAEERICKPDRRIYEIACSRLGIEPSASIFIDDRIKNVNGAIILGMRTILYKDFAQMKGELEALINGADS